MNFSHNGFRATIRHNLQPEKDSWVYTIRSNDSNSVIDEGIAKTALEAVETVEERIRSLQERKSA